MMKSKIRILMRKQCFFWIVFFVSILISTHAHSRVELTVLKDLNLDVSPSDIATSADGSMIYILAQSEILVYESEKKGITERIPIGKGYDRITYSESMKAIVLSSSTSKSLRIIEAEQVFDIPVSGSPFKGKEDAPVLIAVFDDYQ